MTDMDQLQRTSRVLQLLDESFRAHRSGDHATFDRAAQEACALDVDVVSAVQGGILLGEIPSPGRDPAGWADYVAVVTETAAAAPTVDGGCE